MASNRMPTEKHFEYLGLLQLTEVNVELPMWHNLKKNQQTLATSGYGDWRR